MRTLITLLFLLGTGLGLKSQDVFVVMNIKGTVKVNGETLNRMDKITPETTLTFSSLDDFVKVISPKGLVVLRADKTSKRSGNEFIIAVKNALLPPTKFSGTHIRGDTTPTNQLATIYELKAFFRDTLLVIDTTAYEITGPDFVQNASNYFELQLIYDGATKYYQLPFQEHKLQLTCSKILEDFPNLELPHKVRLYYQKEGAAKRKYISYFYLNHMSKNEVLEIIEFLQNTADLDEVTLLGAYLNPYLSAAFGKPYFSQLQAIYKQQKENLDN